MRRIDSYVIICATTAITFSTVLVLLLLKAKMSDHFRVLFESALHAYDKKTGVILAEHPLALQLLTCRSAESITALLQDQARHFGQFEGKDKIMKSIENTVSILFTLSAATALGGTNGLVC